MNAIDEKRAYRREWYQKNKERSNAYVKKWYQKNKERSKAYIKEWRRKNPDKVKIYAHKTYIKNKDKTRLSRRENNRRWRARKMEQCRLMTTQNPALANLNFISIARLQDLLKTNKFYTTKNLMKITGFSRQWLLELRKRRRFWYWKYKERIYYPIKFWRKKQDQSKEGYDTETKRYDT